ncbi:E3 ubiquitin-protein ligase MARCH5 [Galendromus occidentalis]|uniref:E3 ubiquitin-protein ligase MARCHF5 n=1 Tax=Galendromus occidentalis TaxID=34638 RepID=A0AAJ6VZ22_9ACAR|nr:E3 ubiquitin-protein ligase MARCH5 [Galendromus occidentalis]
MDSALEIASDDDRRSCWVCFATDEDDLEASWVEPCKCKGTTKWVHQQCLQRWIDEKQRVNHTQRVNCPQCNTEYLIFFPKFGPFVYVLDLVDRLLYRVSPLLTAAVVLGSVYWSALTYGGITILLVSGQNEGVRIIEQADPIFLSVTLPTIPVMLIVIKMVPWDNYLLKLWWRHASRLPDMRGLCSSLRGELPGNTFVEPPETVNRLLDRTLLNDSYSATRVFVSALMLPAVGALVGRTCFSGVRTPLQRTLLGCFSFIMVKGVFKIYLRRKQVLRQLKRKVLNYGDDINEDEELALYGEDED